MCFILCYFDIIIFDSIEEGVTYRVERDEQTGYEQKVVIESKNKRKVPILRIVDKDENRFLLFVYVG
jgi:hypothetical protein